MSRRNKPEKRDILPDVSLSTACRFRSFINRVMHRGKKSAATTPGVRCP